MDGGDRAKPRLGKRQRSLAGGERANVRKARSGKEQVQVGMGQNASSARGNIVERPLIGYSDSNKSAAGRRFANAFAVFDSFGYTVAQDRVRTCLGRRSHGANAASSTCCDCRTSA